MSYIGPEPQEAFTSYQTETFSVSATTSYTLAHSVANENELALFINNVRQQPGSGKAYTASGTALTLSAATATTDTMYAIYLGRALQTSVPATNSITSDMLASTLISGETDIGGALADADLFLVDDGAGGTLRKTAASRIKTYIGSGLAEADMWRITSGFSGASTPISSNWERADTEDFAVLGTGLSQSSGVFTFPSTGYYFITFQAAYSISGDKRNIGTIIQHTTDNGSNWTELAYSSDHVSQAESDATMTTGVVTGIAHILDTSNDKVRFSAGASSVNTSADTNAQHTGIVCFKLADT